MMRRALIAIAVALPTIASAQRDTTPPRAAIGPAVRRISTASALSTEQLGNIAGVRELPGGRLLLNDGSRRRLLLMDSTLKTIAVVLDSLTEVVNAYGVRQGALMAYRGDSSLFFDPASYAILVLDGEGHIARVRSIPRVRDASWLTQNGSYGWPGVDAKGRLVYRIPAEAGPPLVAPPKGVPWFPQDPDSAFIVGIDFDTRKLDTLGSIRTPKEPYVVKRNGFGFNFTSLTNPMPTTDDWALLSDGTIAFVRSRDYRIEYRAADGTMTSSQKLPFDWVRMTDEDKERLTDSVANAQRRSATTSYVAAMVRWVNTYKQQYPAEFKAPAGWVPQTGYMKDWKLPPGVEFPANYVYGCPPGVEPTMIPAPGAPAPTANASGPPGPPSGTPSCIPQPVSIPGNTPNAPTLRETSVMPAKDLPDYRPPFSNGAVRADVDGNLWVRTLSPKPVPGGPIYDIINRQGELVDRLQVPQGYTLAGFGKGGVVYLSMRDAAGIHLARVRLVGAKPASS